MRHSHKSLQEKQNVNLAPPVDGAICYSQQCFSLHKINDLKSQQELYKYSDPKTDPNFPDSQNPNQYRPPHHVATIVPFVRISPHFSSQELMPTNIERGLFALFSPRALEQIEKLRVDLGRPLRITSGYRSPGYNQELAGAAKWSRHQYGDAIDFKVDGLNFNDLADSCLAYGASFYQLYTDHIHCDWRELPLVEEFFPPAEFPKPSPLKQKPEREGVLIARKISAQTLVLKALTDQEDDGELTYEWQINGPGGYKLESREPQPEIPILKGKFQVSVQVGGSTFIKQEISLP